MAGHRYKVGEILEFQPGRNGFPAASRQCTVVRLLPVEGGDRLYRIKCETEAFERVAREAQLTERA